MKTEFLLTILVAVAGISAGLASNLLTRLFSHPTQAEKSWFAILMIVVILCVGGSILVCISNQVAARRAYWFLGGLVLAAAAVFCLRNGFVTKEPQPEKPAEQHAAPGPSAPKIVDHHNQVVANPHEAKRQAAPADAMPAPTQNLQPPVSQPSQALPAAPGPIQHFFGIVGCAYPEGVPDKITAYSAMNGDELRGRVASFAMTARAFEADRTRKLQAAINLEIDGADPATLARRRQEAIDRASAQLSETWRGDLLEQARPLFDELHVRLRRPYPWSVADGITVNGFGAMCGTLRGPHPLADLSDYMRALAAQVP